MLLGLSAVAAVVGGAGVAIGGASGMRVLQLALVLVGGAAACALDEAAAAVVGACPLSRTQQVLARALAALPALVIGGALVGLWWVVETGDRMLLLEDLGCWVLGFVLATWARRWLDEPAEAVVSALVLGLGSVMLAEPVGHRLMLFPLGGPGLRPALTWAGVLGGGLLVLLTVVPERRWRVR